jgi:hypothetical protein
MGARVFISHRPGDGAGVAIDLAEELDALFGDGQIVRIAAHPAAEERWRDALAGTLDGPPILLAVVSPAPGSGAHGPDEWALQEQLAAALAHGGLILPLLTEGVAALAPDVELPTPFDRLSRLPRLPLRQAEWAGDVARLGEDLRGLGLRPLAGTQPGTMPLPPPDEVPTTTPMPLEEAEPSANDVAAADGGRRGMLGMVAVAALLVAGWGVLRWQERRAADLSGVWRGRIGLRDAPTSRDGGLMLVTLAQKDRSVGLSSTVSIEADPQWQAVREAWRDRNGSELRQVIYRGQGEFIEAGESAAGAASAPAPVELAASAGSGPERARRVDPTLGMRRVVIALQIAAPGTGGERIDQGMFRGVVDVGDQRIHGRLWLESEQAERVVDLRRGD